jgi:hypothetical protein
MFVTFSTPPSPNIVGRGRGEGGDFKSALSPLFMVGLGWCKGQISLSHPQLPPPPTLGGEKGVRGGEIKISSISLIYGRIRFG